MWEMSFSCYMFNVIQSIIYKWKPNAQNPINNEVDFLQVHKQIMNSRLYVGQDTEKI